MIKNILIFLVGAAASQCMALDRETLCLAKNIYYEARGEPMQGQIAVALTTLNRVKSHKFPSSICRVVYQPYQFSWTHQNLAPPRKGPEWDTAVFVAQLTQHTLWKYAKNFKALYFHNYKVRPKWNRNKIVVAKIGKHTFYN
jgi:spore germination cell wall hydrolase CwlJ-like protein